MNRQTRSIFLTISGVTLAVQALGLPLLTPRAIAGSDPVDPRASLEAAMGAGITFEPPKQGMPTDTAGGASRDGGCAREDVSATSCVTPLMPENHYGLTVSERPTFYLYVPETDAKEVFFSLVDENRNHHYQAKLPLDRQEGIIGITLPENAPALAVDRNYQWTVILIGDRGLRPDSPGVQGTVRRVELDATLARQIEGASLTERAALYGENGIWFEALSTLATLEKNGESSAIASSSELENTDNIWQEFLSSVGLQAIATKPILD